MFPTYDPIVVADHQRALRLEAESERLAAMARRSEPRPAGTPLAVRLRGLLAQRLGRLVTAAR
jgi:hypothetical protein